MNIKELLTKDSIIVAILPIFGYVVAIAYEYGYAAHFSYPVSLIVVDLRMTLTSMVLGGAYVYALLRVFDFINAMSDADGYVSKFFRGLASKYMVVMMLMFMSGFGGPVFILALSLFVMYTALQIVFFVFGAKKNGAVAALDELIEESKVKEIPAPRTNYFAGRILKWCHEYGLLVLMMLGLVFGAGRLVATTKQQYSYFELEGSKYIIAAIYGDSVVGVKLKGGVALEDFAVVSKSNDVMSKLGVLYLDKYSSETPVLPVPLPY
ncbi:MULTISPECIES: hypothetical protein [unclassified Pseudomonas]|uniref:hypothetical protein n=1 Tax=unclassified Pseudomonas TaxID=196821 RepID=UPI000A1DDAD9|nr:MULTISPECIES: hypothetical protein [unclassified Pseudomonas]